MKTNNIKEQFLRNKAECYLDDDDKISEFQMPNLKAIKQNGPNYFKLQDENNYSSHFYLKNLTKINTSSNNCPQNTFASKPVTPTASYNFEPNHIYINGMTFIHKDAIKGTIKSQNKVKKPEMQVICQRCSSVQMVPANTHSFICYSCDCTQGCNPQFGIVICGSCQRKVWYPLNTSNLIKCTKCGTVNRIPFIKNFNENQGALNQKNQQEFLLSEVDSQNTEYLSEKYFVNRYPM